MTQTVQQSWLHTAQLQHGRVRRFGDANGNLKGNLAAEVSALGTAGLVPLLGTGALRITGADQLDFLHGQVSNEVKRLKPGESRGALMLNVRGHALALMRVYRREDDLFVAVEGGAGAQVEAQLRAHIIFDQVELHNLADTLLTFTLQGTDVAEVLQRVFGTHLTDLPEPDTFAQPLFASAKVLVGSAPRSRAGGYDLHVLSRDAGALVAALTESGAALAGEDALEALRIEAGIAGAELEGGEGVLPQEAGLEHAVSYRKGCYLGQEIMARIEARGNLRRRLVGLSLRGLPEADAKDLVQNGKTVGRLGGTAEHPRLGIIALASVRTEVGAGAGLEVGGVAAVVSDLPIEK